MPDGDAVGPGVPRPAGGPALVAPASAAGDVGSAEAGAVRAGDGTRLVAPEGVLDAEAWPAAAQAGAGGLRAVRTARRHDHGDPGRRGQRRHHGYREGYARVTPNALP